MTKTITLPRETSCIPVREDRYANTNCDRYMRSQLTHSSNEAKPMNTGNSHEDKTLLSKGVWFVRTVESNPKISLRLKLGNAN